MNQLINVLLTQVLPMIASSAATWYFTRKKNNAEASTNELENVEKALVIYRSIIHDLHEKIKILETELDRVQGMLADARKLKN